jgi:pimeloyl-ACP methyl ester carboxylesterase
VLRNEGFQDELGPIHCPVRIAWGTGDRILRLTSASARLRTLVPHAEFVELPGLGHVPMTDDPELVTRSILEVTTRVDRAYPIPVAAMSSSGQAASAAGGAAYS